MLASNRAFSERQDAFIQNIRSENREAMARCAYLAAEDRRVELDCLSGIAEAAKTTAAIDKASARASGLDRGRGLLGIPTNISRSVEDFFGGVSGQTLIEQRRDGKV